MQRLPIVVLFLIFSVFLIGGCGSSDSSPPNLLLSVPSVEIEKDDFFDPLEYAKATDDVDGDLTSKIVIKSNTVKIDTPGTYSVVYEVKDKANNSSQNSLIVTVKENYTEAEEYAIYAIKALKGVLKDPSSLQVHSINAGEWSTDAYAYTIKIDASAKNGFGGVNRETYYIAVEKDGSVDPLQFDEMSQLANSLGWVAFNEQEINVEKVLKGDL